ncbi:2-oxo-hepta-3-ene-1,7-dioic acid hydratase [Rhodobacteraceae bacterium WD3A24]|nr:2-oxo-hepta-3-ene-1,7-dioic acid hydratase [Rhodobacteraceae bacterium WD3A24]
MTPEEITAAARRLDEAERSGRQIGLLTRDHPDMGLDDAYAVQDAWVAIKREAGRRQIGWKIGLTSKAMQAALNIDTPDSGVLFDDMDFPDGAAIPQGRFIQPRIEAEVAFLLKAPLQGPGLGLTDVLGATDHVCPALEILDTRIVRADPETGQTRKVFDTIADNAANAGLALGGRPMRPDAVDLRWMGAIVSRNAAVEETGLAAGVLNHPAMGLVWLANRLALYGQGLRAGDVVLSGSFIRPVECRRGDTITTDFGPCGTVSLHFE